MDLNKLPSRFAIGDEVTVGVAEERAEVIGVNFTASKVAYLVKFLDSIKDNAVFLSEWVEPAREKRTTESYGGCGVSGVADDCAPFTINPRKWIAGVFGAKRSRA